MSRRLPILVLAGSVFLALAARADEAEDKALKLVKDHGGTVTREETKLGKPVIAIRIGAPTSGGPFAERPTLKGLKGLTAFKTLTALDLSGCRGLTDERMKEVAALTTLTDLNLSGTDASDKGLLALAPMKELTALNLSGTEVSNKGLNELAAPDVLPNLQVLNLSRCQFVSNAGSAPSPDSRT
jgi:internalin A